MQLITLPNRFNLNFKIKKFNKVVDSCICEEQLANTLMWGKSILPKQLHTYVRKTCNLRKAVLRGWAVI